MTEEEQEAIEILSLKAITSSAEAPEYPNTIVMKKDLVIILNLISKLQSDIEIKDKVIEEIKSKLQKHINFCEQESRGHLENKVCHISLKFEKNLLEEVEKVSGEDE